MTLQGWAIKLSRELGVKPPKVIVRSKSRRGDLTGYYCEKRKEITLYLVGSSSSNVHLLVVLAHELYHHYQRERGWLSATGKYKGKALLSQRSRCPCERAAYRYEKKIAARYGLRR